MNSLHKTDILEQSILNIFSEIAETTETIASIQNILKNEHFRIFSSLKYWEAKQNRQNNQTEMQWQIMTNDIKITKGWKPEVAISI